MKPLSEFTKDEKSQLLYLETRLVDHAGRIDVRRMNDADWEIMHRWKKEGFVDFGRVCFEDIKLPGETHWC
jgi:hypothetical protein